MKHLILPFTLFILLALPTQNADAQPGHERVEALKISFITRELNLTPEEAQIFWPVYNQFQEEVNAIQRERRQLHANTRDIANLSNEEAEAALKEWIDLERKELETKTRYHAEFRNVLPPQKVLLLIEAERKFRLQLLEEIKRRREGRSRSRF